MHTYTQTINKLFELYLKLREQGHPDYLSEGKVPSIPCSKPTEDVNATVQDTQLVVTKWTQQMAELHDNYPWLLFFSIPRMLQLYWLIHSKERQVDKIFREVSFLIINQPAQSTITLEKSAGV